MTKFSELQNIDGHIKIIFRSCHPKNNKISTYILTFVLKGLILELSERERGEGNQSDLFRIFYFRNYRNARLLFVKLIFIYLKVRV